MADEPFLSRWSKRKSEARAGAPAEVPPQASALSSASAMELPATKPAEPLPPVESLTPESDFTGFMKPEVDPGLRSKALRTLFQDPHFNVMDGLDTYIADYSQPDPIPESWFSQMKQMERLGAYVEPTPETEPGEPAEKIANALESTQKPLVEQGLAPPAASDASDTGGAGLSPPAVPE